MSTVVDTIDKITKWAEREICEKIRLKCPPLDDEEDNSEGYEYKEVTPACFSMFVPSSEKLPPAVLSPIPSLCVRVLEGSDSMIDSSGTMTIELCFSTWDTGLHGKDVFKPVKGQSGRFERWSGAEANAFFKRNGDGWRDAWNWVDIALRAVESTGSIDGIVIDRSKPVKFGPLTEQEAIPDFYPLWFAWVTFGVKRDILRNKKAYENML